MAKTLNRNLKMGMVGGGPGAFIGEVHRKAARMDGGVDLVAGCFSQSPRKSREQARELNIDKKRAYGSYTEMIEKELALPEGERIDFVSIVTPNDSHFPIASAFWKAGFHVVLDKPMTLDAKEARALRKLVKSKRSQVFALTHNYTGYPMVKLARDMVARGDLGELRKIVVQYPQGWLSTALEKTGAKQAVWRTDPKRSGAAGCMGDIGTHAANLAEYISGLRIREICADLSTFVKGRKLDDDGNVLVHYNKGVKGILFASQISVGEENNLAIWVYGTDKSLEWRQEHPNWLTVKVPDGPAQVWKRGNDYVAEASPAAARATRIPFGHPEAFIEAFANVYVNALDCIRARLEGRKPTALEKDFPGEDEGLRGMLFIEALIKSDQSKQKWTKVPER